MNKVLNIDYEIHKAVFSAQDELLKTANSILRNAHHTENDKSLIANLLKIGFVNQPDVKKLSKKGLKPEVYKARDTINLIRLYQKKYPKNRFIDDDSIKSICNRFGLLFAPVEMYNAEIPLKNMREITHFKCSVKDKRINTSISFINKKASKIITGKKGRTMTTVSLLMPRILNPSFIDFFRNPNVEKEIFIAQKLNEKYGTEITWSNIEEVYQDDVKSKGLTNGMMIAPKNKFKIPKNYSVENGFEVGYKKAVKIKDPVVLQPVIGGYLIVSAWGFEETLPEISGIPNKNISDNLN